jgi:hypothetical protein
MCSSLAPSFSIQGMPSPLIVFMSPRTKALRVESQNSQSAVPAQPSASQGVTLTSCMKGTPARTKDSWARSCHKVPVINTTSSARESGLLRCASNLSWA